MSNQRIDIDDARQGRRGRHAFLILVSSLAHPEELTRRGQETSIFIADNPTRLSYYHQGWSLAQLLVAQFVHAVGIFNQFGDDSGALPQHAVGVLPAFGSFTGMHRIEPRAGDRIFPIADQTVRALPALPVA